MLYEVITSKCAYCAFYSVPLKKTASYNLQKKLIDALLIETETRLSVLEKVSLQTIFIGGGTPSILNPDLLSDFLIRLGKITAGLCKNNIEFTTEANIGSCVITSYSIHYTKLYDFTGYMIKQKNIISDDGVKTLKKLIVTLFLPSTLFFAFLNADLNSKYIFLFAGIFVFCFILYLTGLILKKTSVLDSVYGAEFFTGFEFGMVGIALFSGIFGTAALPVISLIGLGLV